jgi:hypothetical protein
VARRLGMWARRFGVVHHVYSEGDGWEALDAQHGGFRNGLIAIKAEDKAAGEVLGQGSIADEDLRNGRLDGANDRIA